MQNLRNERRGILRNSNEIAKVIDTALEGKGLGDTPIFVNNEECTAITVGIKSSGGSGSFILYGWTYRYEYFYTTSSSPEDSDYVYICQPADDTLHSPTFVRGSIFEGYHMRGAQRAPSLDIIF